MPEPTPGTRAAGAPGNPAQLSVAASLVAVQGLVLLCLAAAEALNVAGDRVSVGVSVAIFFAVYGALLLGCAWALTRRRGWARGPVLITQLIAFGIAWNVRDVVLVAVVLALAAAVTLAAMLSPATLEALLDEQPDQSPDRSPD